MHISWWFSNSGVLRAQGSSCAGSKGWSAWYGAKFLHSSGKIISPLGSFLTVDCHSWGVLFCFVFPLAWPYHCFFYLSWCCPFTLRFGDCSSSFQVPFRGNYSICSCRFVCPREKMSLGTSYTAILIPVSFFLIFHLQNKNIYYSYLILVSSSLMWILDSGKTKEHVFCFTNSWGIRNHSQTWWKRLWITQRL